MSWVWPFPSYVPWDFPRGGLCELTFDNVSGNLLAVDDGWLVPLPTGTNDEGVWLRVGVGMLHFHGVIPDAKSGAQVGSGPVEQGDLIGHVGDEGVVTIKCYAVDELPRDPSPFLLPAWTRVTPRFHRDVADVEYSACRETLLWLEYHPLWTYTETVMAPTAGITGVPTTAKETYELGCMSQCLRIESVFVDPTINGVRGFDHWSSSSRNTHFQVHIKAGGWVDLSKRAGCRPPSGGWFDSGGVSHEYRWVPTPDEDLEVREESLPRALLRLASKVKFFYGEGRLRLSGRRPCLGGQCEPAWDGFCVDCGFLMVGG